MKVHELRFALQAFPPDAEIKIEEIDESGESTEFPLVTVTCSNQGPVVFHRKRT